MCSDLDYCWNKKVLYVLSDLLTLWTFHCTTKHVFWHWTFLHCRNPGDLFIRYHGYLLWLPQDAFCSVCISQGAFIISYCEQEGSRKKSIIMKRILISKCIKNSLMSDFYCFFFERKRKPFKTKNLNYCYKIGTSFPLLPVV